MPNNYFQFKQFLIQQEKCAMKVCTDACLFGAWAANCLPLTVHRLLDIGTGTGLLSLMLAQKNNDIIIDAIEIDEAAVQQAKENFNHSRWRNRLNVQHISIQQFADVQTQLQYDVIICNPPFFENDLKSVNEQRNIALHSETLSLQELIFAVDNLLAQSGTFFCLLPFHRTNFFEDLVLKKNLHVKQKVFVKQTSSHNYFRTIFCVDKTSRSSHQSEITILNTENKYTDNFKELLKDYYLIF